MQTIFRSLTRAARDQSPEATRRRSVSFRRLRKNSGFTILEVAMASFVMALGISTSIIAMQSGFKQIDVARGTTLSAQILQSELERLRMMPWSNPGGAVDSILELPATETFDGASNFSSSTDVVGHFSVVRTVTDETGAARAGLVRNIKVAVRWKSYDGRWHERSFKTIYSKNGLYDYYYSTAHP